MPKISEVLDQLYEARPPRHSVTLSKGQKNTYAWDIKAESENPDDLLKLIRQIDSELRKSYGAQKEEKKPNT